MSAIKKLIKKYLAAANEKLVDGYEDRGYEMQDEAKKAAAELARKDEALRLARELVERWMQGAKDLVIHYPADSAQKLTLMDCASDLALALTALRGQEVTP